VSLEGVLRKSNGSKATDEKIQEKTTTLYMVFQKELYNFESV
jgi:hypothetical protein